MRFGSAAIGLEPASRILWGSSFIKN